MKSLKHLLIFCAALGLSTLTNASGFGYSLESAEFTPRQNIIIHLPYDVDTAFYMAKNSWGLRDDQDLLDEGGQQWLNSKIKDGSWGFSAQPGEYYEIKDENTIKTSPDNGYTFFISAKFEGNAMGTSKISLSYQGLGKNIDEEKLLEKLLRLSYLPVIES